MSLSYTQALSVSTYLTRRGVGAHIRQANKLLEAKCNEIGRSRTFVIVRFGDPRKWEGKIPKGKIKPIIMGEKRFSSLASHKAYRKRLRAVILQHGGSGRIIKAESISAFCRAARLDKHARFHINPVLDGQRASFKGWYLPETLAATLALTDVYGNNMTLPFVTWIKEPYRFKPGTLFKMLKGGRTQLPARRVALSSAPFKTIIQPKADQTVSCTIARRGGKPIRAANLSQAAQKVGLNPSALYPAAYGLTPEVRGYRVKEVIMERRSAFSA